MYFFCPLILSFSLFSAAEGESANDIEEQLVSKIPIFGASPDQLEFACVGMSEKASYFSKMCFKEDLEFYPSDDPMSWGVCLFPEMELQLVIHLKSILQAKMGISSLDGIEDLPHVRKKRCLSLPNSFENKPQLRHKRASFFDDPQLPLHSPQILQCPLSRFSLDGGFMSVSPECGNAINIASFSSYSISDSSHRIFCDQPQNQISFHVMSHGRVALSNDSSVLIDTGSFETRSFSAVSIENAKVSIINGGRAIFTGLWTIAGPYSEFVVSEDALVRSSDMNYATRPQVQIEDSSTFQVSGKDTYVFLEWADFVSKNSTIFISEQANFVLQSSKVFFSSSFVFVTNKAYLSLTTQGSPASSTVLDSQITMTEGSLIVRDKLDLGKNCLVELSGRTSRFQVNRLETGVNGNSKFQILDSQITFWDKIFVSDSVFSVKNSRIEGSRPVEIAILGPESLFLINDGSFLDMSPYSTLTMGSATVLKLSQSNIAIGTKASFVMRDSFGDGTIDSLSELDLLNTNITLSEMAKLTITDGVRLSFYNAAINIGFRAELRFQIAPRMFPDLEPPAIISKQIDLSFQSFPTDKIMNAVLPQKVSAIKSFSQVGHIIHLNLREEQVPHGNIIGEILLETIPSCRTVINKANSIDAKFRNFKIDLLAGEPDYVTSIKEKGCEYTMDFSKVFWNSRLSTEHERIVKKYLSKRNKSIVYDVFAGIGPFSVPAAKEGCIVLANDLNPESVKYLEINERKNKVKFESTHNLDGADFIQNIISSDLMKRLEKQENIAAHAIMNLPALAIEFLPKFIGILNSENAGKDSSESHDISNGDSKASSQNLDKNLQFTVHCHLFSRAEDYTTDAKLLVEHQFEGFNQPEDYEIIDVHDVRNVAPTKQMLCVTIRVKKSILCGRNHADSSFPKTSDNSEPPLKRLCCD